MSITTYSWEPTSVTSTTTLICPYIYIYIYIHTHTHLLTMFPYSNPQQLLPTLICASTFCTHTHTHIYIYIQGILSQYFVLTSHTASTNSSHSVYMYLYKTFFHNISIFTSPPEPLQLLPLLNPLSLTPPCKVPPLWPPPLSTPPGDSVEGMCRKDATKRTTANTSIAFWNAHSHALPACSCIYVCMLHAWTCTYVTFWNAHLHLAPVHINCLCVYMCIYNLYV